MQFFVTADWIPIPSLKDKEMAIVKSQKKSDPYKIGNLLYFCLSDFLNWVEKKTWGFAIESIGDWN